MSIAKANALRAAKANVDTPEKFQHFMENVSGEEMEEMDAAIFWLNLTGEPYDGDHADLMALFDEAIAEEEKEP